MYDIRISQAKQLNKIFLVSVRAQSMFNSVGLNESPMVFLQSQYLTNPTPDFYQTYYELSAGVPTDSGVGIRGF